MNDGDQQLVSKVFSTFCNSKPPDTELRFSASYVHEAEHEAGGVKVVVSAGKVSVCAMVCSESTLSSSCPEHGRAERYGYVHQGLERMEMKEMESIHYSGLTEGA